MSLLVGLLISGSLTASPQGWTQRDPPSTAGAMAPNLAVAGDTIVLTWLEPVSGADDQHEVDAKRTFRLRFASFADGTWSAPATIAQRDDFFANWADIPSLAQAADESFTAHWLQRSGPDTFAYDVVLARSTDGGKTWQTLGPAHHDGTQTEHGFVSLVGQADGVRAWWLDGREMAAGDGSGNMSLRTALIGETVGDSVVLDDRVCECCSTSAVMTAEGPLIVYRDRGAQEIRDISIVRSVAGKWTEPQTVHADGWRIAACPVNGPAVDARGSLVVVAWYTGAADGPVVRAAFSSDAGATFGEPITVDDTMPLGRVDVVLTPSRQALVSWLDTGDAGGAIMLRHITADGWMGPSVKLAGTTTARASGFPKMAMIGSTVLVVWTEEGETTRLRAASLAFGAATQPSSAPSSK